MTDQTVTSPERFIDGRERFLATLAMVCAFIPGIGLAATEALGAEWLPGWR